MYRKTTPTVNNWVDKILKSFLNPKGFIEFTNDVDPEFIQKMDQGKTIPNPFLIVLKDETCPKCGAKLNKNGNDNFNLNNTLLIFKKKYSCSNKECNNSFRTPWDKYIEPNCNYTNKIKEYCSNISSIERLSYQKEAERIKIEKNVEIRRETLFKFHKEKSQEDLIEKEKTQEKELKEKNIELSNILAYDEQYIPIKGEMHFRLTAIDPVTNWIYDNKIIDKENFNLKTIKNFIKDTIGDRNIDTIVTDGSNKYPTIIAELGLNHKLCNFHHMKNFIDTNKRKINHLKREEKKQTRLINETNEKLAELKAKRKNKRGRIKNNDYKAKRLNEKIKSLELKKSRLKDKRRKNKNEIMQYEKCIHDLSLLLKSKTKKTGIKRYQKIIENLDNIPSKTHYFFRKTGKKLENLLLHTTNPQIPTTNNQMELTFLTTFNRHDKKKYKTQKGVETEIRYRTLRWNKRMALENF